MPRRVARRPARRLDVIDRPSVGEKQKARVRIRLATLEMRGGLLGGDRAKFLHQREHRLVVEADDAAALGSVEREPDRSIGFFVLGHARQTLPQQKPTA